MSSLMQEDSVQLALVGVTSSVIEEYDPARSSNPVKKKKPKTQTQWKKKKEKEKKEKTPEIPTWWKKKSVKGKRKKKWWRNQTHWT